MLLRVRPPLTRFPCIQYKVCAARGASVLVRGLPCANTQNSQEVLKKCNQEAFIFFAFKISRWLVGPLKQMPA